MAAQTVKDTTLQLDFFLETTILKGNQQFENAILRKLLQFKQFANYYRISFTIQFETFRMQQVIALAISPL